MPYTENFTEGWELIDVVYGAAVAAATETNSGYNSLANFHRIAIIIHPVVLNDALDVDIEEGTSTGGAGAQALAAGGHDITVAAADTLPSVIELQTEELDVSDSYDCVNVEITTANTGGQGNYFVCEIWGYPRFKPAATTNLDSVTG